MPRNGLGQLVPLPDSIAVPATLIRSAPYNEQVSDLANEITNSLPRDGQAGMLARLNMGGFEVFNGSPATAGTSLITLDQLNELAGATATTVAALKQLASGASQVVVVQGYYAQADGGGGTFFWNATSVDPDNGGTIIAPAANPPAGRWIRAVDRAINIKWFGARGDGVQIDQPHIQAAIDAAVLLGRELIFQKGTYLVTSKITRTGQRIIIRGEPGAVIADKVATGHCFEFIACHDSIVEGLIFRGPETMASYLANVPTSVADIYASIHAVDCTRFQARRLTVSGKRCAVWLDGCDHSGVEDYRVEGYLVGTYDTPITGANLVQAVRISGGGAALPQTKGFDNYASHGVVTNHGSAVLVASDAYGGVIDSIWGQDIYDNLVYISSGHRFSVTDCYGERVTGTVIKCRGSQNSVVRCRGKTCRTGVSMTGNGAAYDEYGANGHGNKVIDCVIEDYGNSVGDGIGLLDQDDFPTGVNLYQRDALISGCTLIGGKGTGGFAAIRAVVTRGLTIVGTTVDGTAGDHSVVISAATVLADYDGDGATTVFAVPFKFVNENELNVVEVDVATGIETTKVIVTHYTVSGGGGVGATGSVSAVVAPAIGKRWSIRRPAKARDVHLLYNTFRKSAGRVLKLTNLDGVTMAFNAYDSFQGSAAIELTSVLNSVLMGEMVYDRNLSRTDVLFGAYGNRIYGCMGLTPTGPTTGVNHPGGSISRFGDGMELWGFLLVDPPSLAAGASQAFNMSVPGAIVGKHSVTGIWYDGELNGTVMRDATVTAADVVTVWHHNPTGGAVNVQGADGMWVLLESRQA